MKMSEQSVQKPSQMQDIGSLSEEIGLFLDNVYAQNDPVPDRATSKAQCPKWRFQVKGYLKALRDHYTEGEEAVLAAELLEKLYRMLCYGCCYYIFGTTDTFRSVGWAQDELLDLVIKKIFAQGIDRESIARAVSLAAENGTGSTAGPNRLLEVLIANLKTADARQMAIEEADRQRQNPSGEEAYLRREKADHLTRLVLRLSLVLCEYEEGIRYFKRYSQEGSRETVYFLLLECLYVYDLPDYWQAEYQEALKEKVDLRGSLREAYAYLRQHGKFPEDYWYL